jgi:hypothetical protein
MTRKTVPFNKTGIGKLPNNAPATYRIQTAGGKTNYVGVAKRGRVRERIAEHLPGAKDYIPGAKVVVEQQPNIGTARGKEARAIRRGQPRYNRQGR